MAEFPELGQHCTVDGCKQLDFLPLTCTHCNLVFCKDHHSISGHDCREYPDNQCDTVKSTDQQWWKCSVIGCKSKSDPVHQPCLSCNAHICLQHRHEPPKSHSCPSASQKKDVSVKQRIAEREKNKKRFADAFNAVEKEIDGKLQTALTSKKAKDKDMANRLILMRLKSRAIGAPKSSVPESSRAYFDIFPPPAPDVKPASVAIYVSKLWSLGRATEAVEKIFKLRNKSPQKLRLYFHASGKVISNDLSQTIGSLIDDGVLVDGETLVLDNEEKEES